MFHAFSGGRRSPSPIILPLPLTIRSYISPSDIPESTPGVAQSFIVRLIEAATSPLPSPASPWHMAQSYPKIFFAVAIPSGVALTGFFRSTPVGGFAASAVAATAAGGAGAGAAPLSLALSCCAVETLNPVSSTTPAQTNPWRIKTSSLRITPGMFGPDERNRRHTPAGYLRGFYTRELRGQQEIFRFLARGRTNGPGRVYRLCKGGLGLVHIPPVRPRTDFHFKRNFQLIHAFHLLLHQFRERALLPGRGLEQQFIVHLQDHLRLHLFLAQPLVNSDHRQLDQVRRRTLQRRVQRRSLREIAQLDLRRQDLRYGPDPAEQSARFAAFTGLFQHPVQVGFDALVARKIRRDKTRRLLLRHVDLLRQAERRKPVNNSKIDGFRRAPVLGSLRQRTDAKDLLRRAGVYVFAVPERFHQHRILRKVRHHPQFDLGIIGRKQNLSLLRHKRRADLPPQFGSDRNVLQVRIARTEPSRRGHGLADAGVHAPGVGMDQLRQRIDVSGLQLRHFAVLDHFPRHRMPGAQLLQDLGRRRARFRPSSFRGHAQVQLVEQDLRQLNRRIYVEFRPGQLPDLLLEPPHLLFHGFGKLCERFRIDPHSRPFHFRQHYRQRQLDSFVDPRQSLLFNRRTQRRRQPVQRVGLFPCPAACGYVELPEHNVRQIVF